MFGRGHNRVIQRGTSARIDLFQRLFQLQQIVGEVLIEIVFVVEIHHEDFVLGIARPHQVQRRLIHLVPLLPHRPRVVDHDAHRDRDVLVVKRDDVLLLPVLKHRERAPVQIGDDVLLVVLHSGVQKNFVHILA